MENYLSVNTFGSVASDSINIINTKEFVCFSLRLNSSTDFDLAGTTDIVENLSGA